MSFKIHLIIVSFIIATLYVVRVFFLEQPAQPVNTTKVATASPYHLSVVHASWGFNCKVFMPSKQYPLVNNYSQQYDIDTSKINEDNVLSAVSNICNGKSSCVINLDTNTLGEDPLPSCGNKILQVDYRCFSVDKLRTARAAVGQINIDCDKEIQ